MKIPFKNTDGKDDYYSFDDWLCSQLDGVRKSINTQDQDFVLALDGPEGKGKSTFAAQVAYYVDPTFCQERMCLTPEEFIKGINSASKGQAVVYDEAYAGLGSSSVLSPINRLLTAMMMEMRKKNLFVILVLPSFFYLSRYAALHRAQVLLHVYARGKFLTYNSKKMKQLYLYGKKKMSYNYPKAYIQKNFVKKTPIDWKAYEDRKIESLKEKEGSNLKQGTKNLIIKQKEQRDLAIRMILETTGMKQVDLAKKFKEAGLKMDRGLIVEAANRKLDVPDEDFYKIEVKH